MGFGFGATGLQGEACPVPAADGIIPFTFKAETHDRWCDCMYSSDPGLLRLCKVKFMEKLPNGDTYLDPSMPWTVTGKRTRGLTDDALGRLLQQLVHAGSGALDTVQNEIGVQISPESTHPAGPAGPVGTMTSPNTQSMYLSRFQTGAPKIGQSGESSWMPDISIPKQVSTNSLLVAGGIAAAVWYFFLRPKRVTLGGFSGYGKRRRRRLRTR
ncbi:MAG: hypothetical protein WAV09_03030 [Minisyncoccia bacterium]